MRVLSPRIEPPVRVDDGSTASTATRKPCEVSSVPNASMNVDLPTPGTPLMPIRRARAAVREEFGQQLLGHEPVLGLRRLDEGDGAGHEGPLAVEDALHIGVELDHRVCPRSAASRRTRS